LPILGTAHVNLPAGFRGVINLQTQETAPVELRRCAVAFAQRPKTTARGDKIKATPFLEFFPESIYCAVSFWFSENSHLKKIL